MFIKFKIFIVNLLMFIAICNYPLIASAESTEPEIIEADGIATLGDNVKVAEEMAYQAALRNAADQAGVYVESYIVAQNFKLTKDEIRIVSAAVLKVIGTPNFEYETESTNKKAVQIICHIKAKVDKSVIDEVVADKQKRK